MRACLLMLLTVLGSLSAHAATKQWEMTAQRESTTQAFYGWVLSHRASSLPSPAERKQLAAFMDPAFIDLLRETSAAEQRCIAVTPIGNKGDIFEGSLFVGNFEGATEVAYGATRRKGRNAYVDVALMYTEQRFPKGHKYRSVAWHDRLKLSFDGHRWWVSDVIRGKTKSLSDELKKYIVEDSMHCGDR
jgi:hypothetical protein